MMRLYLTPAPAYFSCERAASQSLYSIRLSRAGKLSTLQVYRVQTLVCSGGMAGLSIEIGSTCRLLLPSAA
jgi:hypothetical protein